MQIFLKKKHFLAFLVSVFVLLGLTACAPSISPDEYTVGNSGYAGYVKLGVIKDIRYVRVRGGSTAVGTTAGAALGGIAAGSSIGQGSGSLVAAIGGAIVGGVIGHNVEQGATMQSGYEFIIRLRGGRMISVVQGATQGFYLGQHVLVEFGNQRTRVIPDNNYR